MSTLILSPATDADTEYECPYCDHREPSQPAPEHTTPLWECRSCEETSPPETWEQVRRLLVHVKADDCHTWSGRYIIDPEEGEMRDFIICPECGHIHDPGEPTVTMGGFECPSCDRDTDPSEWIERRPDYHVEVDVYGAGDEEDVEDVVKSINYVSLTDGPGYAVGNFSFDNGKGEYVSGEHAVLVLKTVRIDPDTNEMYSNYTPSFKYPGRGEYVEDPTFQDNESCGGGIHGLPWGLGDLSHLSTEDPTVRFLLIGVDKRDGYVTVGGDKCKFRRGKIIAVYTTYAQAYTSVQPYQPVGRSYKVDMATLMHAIRNNRNSDQGSSYLPTELRVAAGTYPGVVTEA